MTNVHAIYLKEMGITEWVSREASAETLPESAVASTAASSAPELSAAQARAY